MEKKLKNGKVFELGEFAYRIESADIVVDGEERRRGIIIKHLGEVTTIPFKPSEGKRRKSHVIRENNNGKLTLSPKMQSITVTLRFDRESDSPEAIMAACEELTKDYLVDVLKFELDQCLSPS